MMKRPARRVVRYDTKLPVDAARARLERAVHAPGLGKHLWRRLREPTTSPVYGVIDGRTFWVRLRTRRNAWKPTAFGRIDPNDAGSVVSVETKGPNASWFVPAIIGIYLLALAGASLTYGGLPPGNLLFGGSAVALLAVVIGLLGPRLALYERDQIEAVLSRVLDCQGVEVWSPEP